jgi:hypothetical protein
VGRLGVRGGLLVALVLAAACGGDSGRSAAHHSPTPSASGLATASSPSPDVHPPTLSAPPSSFGPYSTAAAAERYVSANGLAAQAPEATWRPAAVLHVIHASSTTGADSPGDWYFFFVGGKAVGQRYFTRASSADAVDDVTFAVSYLVFRQGDPHCCPSGGSSTVRFRWQGGQLTALDAMPGPIQT